jgi:glutamate-1-semialdehyde 2,1-aminomutase
MTPNIENKNMTSTTDRNQQLFDRARALIPGGVNSPVRAFRAVGGTPRFVQRAQGAYFWDANGNRHIDYIGSWGPMILGHGHPRVLEAVQRAVQEGFSYGAPTEREIELAEEIVKHLPSVEMVRLVSSGTEAAMSAIRLARGATGRSRIVKFEGCYHGHADALLVKAGSGLATFGHPTSAGVPPEVVQHTMVLEYNNIAQIEEAFATHGKEIACIIIEPIAGNMNFVRASVPFMQRCRELCTRHGALLVLDEGDDRVPRGAGRRAGRLCASPSRLPAGPDGAGQGDRRRHAAGGLRRPARDHGAARAAGPVYQAGTLSGNPVATACGLATLKEIADPDSSTPGAETRTLVDGLRRRGAKRACLRGGLRRRHVRLLPAAAAAAELSGGDEERSPRFGQLFHGLLDRGVYIAPALYEAAS